MESSYNYYYRNNPDTSYYVFNDIYYQTTPNKWLYLSKKKLDLPEVYYSPVEKKEVFKLDHVSQVIATEVVDTVTIITPTISGNFAHAILDHLLPLFCIMNDYDTKIKYNLFIDKHKIRKFKCAKNIIDFTKKRYTNFIDKLIEPFIEKVIFQIGLGDNKIIHIKKLLVGGVTNYSRSIWTNENFQNYRVRDYTLSNQYFSKMFQKFSKRYIEYFAIPSSQPNLIVVCNRWKVRGFTKESSINLLDKIKGLKLPDLEVYGQVLYFEDISLEESIEIMGKTKILITPHGANITNSIWMNPESKILEVFPFPDNRECYFRSLSNILRCNYYHLFQEDNKKRNYDIYWDVNCIKILDILNSICN